ncbi:hypothetical protein QJS04_geneDACA001997 [Acorus gramineus]|uniref:TFIIS central domain-containing protein n=1 Tax=Acorus gramineus TaxID=55184 RepID=A0AAV9A9T1_ACOGR|nr:hypothetical protein QJS04_geneDACA001997 [Acorus gramineus]
MALTRDSCRNKWLEKLLQGIQSVCSLENVPLGDELENSGIGMKAINGSQRADDKEMASSSFVKAINRSQHDIILDGERFCWPDDAVTVVIALERASHGSLGSNFQKYNQKMRQLDFNLKTNVLLAKRLLNKELELSVILNMSPNELKDGLTADEKATRILRDLNECR